MSAANCDFCEQNYYCPDYGLDQSTMTAVANQCPNGYVCLGGAVHPSNLDEVTIKLCDAGKFCPNTPG
jgi:hypothetical protein